MNQIKMEIFCIKITQENAVQNRKKKLLNKKKKIKPGQGYITRYIKKAREQSFKEKKGYEKRSN